ncbi:MAG: peptidylprolyl isomerase [Akkermansiaceae bacterium]|nr:peptidylprolyl isomerase [Akkermansiaceae bacterium]
MMTSFFFRRFGLFAILAFLGMVAPLFGGAMLLPVLNTPIADRSGLANSPLVVDVASAFKMEPIDDQIVRFSSWFRSGGVPLSLDMAIFSNRAPITRQNFLKYVSDGDFVNSFIHRSVPGFVIQGGGFRLSSSGIEPVPTDPTIANEFGISNTLGTIAMAKLGSSPNSATSQWFVSLGGNSDILDPQNGGFTVFGRMTKATLSTAQLFGNPQFFPTWSFNSPFDELPLFYGYNSQTDDPLNNVILFNSVALAPLPAGQAGSNSTMSYSVISNSDSTIASTSMQSDGRLLVTPSVGKTGTISITVRATDSVGNTVDDTLSVNVNLSDTYSTWASRNSFVGGQSGMTQNPEGDVWNNLQEFAFLGDPATSNSPANVVFQGVTGVTQKSLTITFPVRKFTQGLSYAVEASDALSGSWTEIWKSADGFASSRVVSAVEQADRTILTVKDLVFMSGQAKRFMRVKVAQN